MVTQRHPSPGHPASLLAVIAHPDDAELWAGGTLALHARRAAVTIALPRPDPAREAEARACAAILGAALHILPSTAAAQDLTALIIAIRPDILITHPIADVHPDHRHIAAQTLAALPDAVIATGSPRRLYTTDTYNSLTTDGPVRASTIIDITETFSLKAQALAAHDGTQPITSHFGPMAATLARLWGSRIGTTYGEAFTAIPILGRLSPQPAASSRSAKRVSLSSTSQPDMRQRNRRLSTSTQPRDVLVTSTHPQAPGINRLTSRG